MQTLVAAENRIDTKLLEKAEEIDVFTGFTIGHLDALRHSLLRSERPFISSRMMSICSNRRLCSATSVNSGWTANIFVRPES